VMIMDTYRDARDMPKALDAARKAADAYPKDRGILIAQALLFGENAQADQAVAKLHSLLDGSAADFEVQLDIAQVFEQSKRWSEAEQAIQSNQWDLVILDEINYAISYGMLDPAKVAESLRRKPDMVHVILTGRNAHPTIVELADTVTEMRQIKHAYEKGVQAQKGIEY